MTIERGEGRPKRGYRLESGAKVPGVTTVIGRFKEAGGLIRWAYKRGLDGEELYDSRDKAGELGSHVHDAVEIEINGGDPRAHLEGLELEGEDRESVFNAYRAYEEWREGQRIELLATEVALISEEHGFGGTLDAIARIGEKLVLLDWKTSNGVYTDYLVQLGAYAILWREGRGQSVEGAHLCRFSKRSGGFAHHYWPRHVLGIAAKQFLGLLECYRRDKDLKDAM